MKIEQFRRRERRLLERYFGDSAMTRLLKSYADIAKEERQRGMIEQKSPDGRKFQRLKASTVRQKKRRGSSDPSKALIDKGIMKNPITKADSKRGRVVPPRSREKIIQYHQEGTRHIPARPHWGIYTAAERRIQRLWKKQLAKFVRELARG